MTPRVAIIAAVARNNVIGSGNQVPWRLPSDLAFFKRVTMGKPLIMGRKTYESIGKRLEGRTNIVLTRDRALDAPGVMVAHTFDDALAAARQVAAADGADEIFVIGGGQVYARAMQDADRLYITHVDAEPEGDTAFPKIDPEKWAGWASSDIEPSEKDSTTYRVRIYERRQSRPGSH